MSPDNRTSGISLLGKDPLNLMFGTRLSTILRDVTSSSFHLPPFCPLPMLRPQSMRISPASNLCLHTKSNITGHQYARSIFIAGIPSIRFSRSVSGQDHCFIRNISSRGLLRSRCLIYHGQKEGPIRLLDYAQTVRFHGLTKWPAKEEIQCFRGQIEVFHYEMSHMLVKTE
jgi:hypothetical protein